MVYGNGNSDVAWGDIEDVQPFVLDFTLILLFIITIVLSMLNLYYCLCKSGHGTSTTGNKLQSQYYPNEERDENEEQHLVV